MTLEMESSFKILIVDDEPKNIQLLGNLLRDKGYSVEFALSGEEAMDWLNTSPFDLVLLDIVMPGMDGYEVCRRIKGDSMKRHIPVIFLTVKTSQDDILKGFEAGGSDYVLKPFSPPELLARIKVQAELKVLRGFIPICANCKNIRDNEGEWSQLEAYIQERSPVLFSHSICPDCMEKIYGADEWYKRHSDEKE